MPFSKSPFWSAVDTQGVGIGVGGGGAGPGVLVGMVQGPLYRAIRVWAVLLAFT